MALLRRAKTSNSDPGFAAFRTERSRTRFYAFAAFGAGLNVLFLRPGLTYLSCCSIAAACQAQFLACLFIDAFAAFFTFFAAGRRAFKAFLAGGAIAANVAAVFFAFLLFYRF
jgi:hypothetical protein